MDIYNVGIAIARIVNSDIKFDKVLPFIGNWVSRELEFKEDYPSGESESDSSSEQDEEEDEKSENDNNDKAMEFKEDYPSGESDSINEEDQEEDEKSKNDNNDEATGTTKNKEKFTEKYFQACIVELEGTILCNLLEAKELGHDEEKCMEYAVDRTMKCNAFQVLKEKSFAKLISKSDMNKKALCVFKKLFEKSSPSVEVDITPVLITFNADVVADDENSCESSVYSFHDDDYKAALNFLDQQKQNNQHKKRKTPNTEAAAKKEKQPIPLFGNSSFTTILSGHWQEPDYDTSFSGEQQEVHFGLAVIVRYSTNDNNEEVNRNVQQKTD